MSTESNPSRAVTVERIVDGPRERVFRAWTEAEQLAQWWGPAGFSNPVCEVDPRPGGALRIVMRSPQGVDYPMRGIFREVVAPERLAFGSVAEDASGNPLLEGESTITFADLDGRTRLTVQSSAVGIAPVAAQMIAGMEAGWTQSLERLAGLIGPAGS